MGPLTLHRTWFTLYVVPFLTIRIIFADVSLMLNNRMTLLLDDDLGEVAVAADRLREILPDINVDRYGLVRP